MRAAYDDIADWYENEFLVRQRSGLPDADYADALGIDQALVELLGRGGGPCLEVGCGTGIYADRIASLGWRAVGVDISAGMLAYARERLPVALGDGRQLPFASASFSAVVTVMTHTDIPDYRSMLNEIRRVLAPGGRFLHVGVHPCFCGAFADRSEPPNVLVRPGYLDSGWTSGLGPEYGELGRDGQVRDKVGAGHLSLAELVNMIVRAGFVVERLAEGFEPTPITLAVQAGTG